MNLSTFHSFLEEIECDGIGIGIGWRGGIIFFYFGAKINPVPFKIKSKKDEDMVCHSLGTVATGLFTESVSASETKELKS